MKRLILIMLLVALVLPGSVLVQAQDGGELQCSDADIVAAIDQAAADLDAARQLSGTSMLEALAQVQAKLAALDYGCRHMAEATGTPSDPLPIGEYYEFEGGLVRVVSFGAAPEGVGRPNEGYNAWAVELEYVCQVADPDETCKSMDFSVVNIVTPEGVVLDRESIYGTDSTWSGAEAFAGNTLQGVYYFQFPADQSIAMLKFLDMRGFDHVYVDVSGGAG